MEINKQYNNIINDIEYFINDNGSNISKCNSDNEKSDTLGCQIMLPSNKIRTSFRDKLSKHTKHKLPIKNKIKSIAKIGECENCRHKPNTSIKTITNDGFLSEVVCKEYTRDGACNCIDEKEVGYNMISKNVIENKEFLNSNNNNYLQSTEYFINEHQV